MILIMIILLALVMTDEMTREEAIREIKEEKGSVSDFYKLFLFEIEKHLHSPRSPRKTTHNKHIILP